MGIGREGRGEPLVSSWPLNFTFFFCTTLCSGAHIPHSGMLSAEDFFYSCRVVEASSFCHGIRCVSTYSLGVRDVLNETKINK